MIGKQLTWGATENTGAMTTCKDMKYIRKGVGTEQIGTVV